MVLMVQDRPFAVHPHRCHRALLLPGERYACAAVRRRPDRRLKHWTGPLTPLTRLATWRLSVFPTHLPLWGLDTLGLSQR